MLPQSLYKKIQRSILYNFLYEVKKNHFFLSISRQNTKFGYQVKYMLVTKKDKCFAIILYIMYLNEFGVRSHVPPTR